MRLVIPEFRNHSLLRVVRTKSPLAPLCKEGLKQRRTNSPFEKGGCKGDLNEKTLTVICTSSLGFRDLDFADAFDGVGQHLCVFIPELLKFRSI